MVAMLISWVTMVCNTSVISKIVLSLPHHHVHRVSTEGCLNNLGSLLNSQMAQADVF